MEARSGRTVGPSRKLRTAEDIECLADVNGITIEHIERRAIPLDDKTQDKEEWPCRSATGFLSPGERFKDVLRSDWQSVSALGTTHIELAGHLCRILQLSRSITAVGQIEYDASGLIGNSLAQHQGKPQPLAIVKQFYMGDQYSLFYDFDAAAKKEKKETNKGGKDTDVANQMWNVECRIENVNNGVAVLVGGHEGAGVVTYIEDYGFYEGGGVRNEYRVDPILLHAVLTGICRPEAIDLIALKGRVRLDEMVAERRRDKQRKKELLAGVDGEEVKDARMRRDELEWLVCRMRRTKAEAAAMAAEVEGAVKKASAFLVDSDSH